MTKVSFTQLSGYLGLLFACSGQMKPILPHPLFTHICVFVLLYFVEFEIATLGTSKRNVENIFLSDLIIDSDQFAIEIEVELILCSEIVNLVWFL